MPGKRTATEAGMPDRPMWKKTVANMQDTPFGNVTPVEVSVSEDTAAAALDTGGYVGLTEIHTAPGAQPGRRGRQMVSLLPWQNQETVLPRCNRRNVERAVSELQAVWWKYTEEQRDSALVQDQPLETPWVKVEVEHSRPFLRSREPYTFQLPHYVHDPHSARVFIGVSHGHAKKRIQEELALDLPSSVVSQIKVKRLPRLVRAYNTTEAKVKIRDGYDIFLGDYSFKNIGYFNNFGRNHKFPLRLTGDVGKDVAKSYKTGQLQPRDELCWFGIVARVGMTTERVVDNVETAINSIASYFPDVAQIKITVDGLPRMFSLTVYCGANAICNSHLQAPYRVQSGRIKSFPIVHGDFDYLSNQRDVEKLGKKIYNQ